MITIQNFDHMCTHLPEQTKENSSISFKLISICIKHHSVTSRAKPQKYLMMHVAERSLLQTLDTKHVFVSKQLATSSGLIHSYLQCSIPDMHTGNVASRTSIGAHNFSEIRYQARCTGMNTNTPCLGLPHGLRTILGSCTITSSRMLVNPCSLSRSYWLG